MADREHFAAGVTVLINGQSAHCIEIADRGFQYGDGVFTTLPVEGGRPILLGHHLARLSRDCGRLAIPFPGEAILAAEAAQLCRAQADGVLKIQITRGSGLRGYRPPTEPAPNRVLSLQPAALGTNAGVDAGARVIVCRHRLGRNPALAGVKHMNRLEQILARAEWDSPAVHEGLTLDDTGALIEGTMSNVFLVCGNRLVTPDLSQCGVEGVMRSLVLGLASEAGIDTETRRVSPDELAIATEVFLTNSLIRIRPVVALEALTWAVGAVTRRLTERVEARIRAEAGWSA